MVCWQATGQIENRGDTVKTEKLKSVTLLCKNNLLFDKLEPKVTFSHTTNIQLVQKSL